MLTFFAIEKKPVPTIGVRPARRVQVSFASIENVFNALLLNTPIILFKVLPCICYRHMLTALILILAFTLYSQAILKYDRPIHIRKRIRKLRRQALHYNSIILVLMVILNTFSNVHYAGYHDIQWYYLIFILVKCIEIANFHSKTIGVFRSKA